MTRNTSIQAYNRIKTQGLLSERRWQVYHCLYQVGPATASEVYREFKKQYGKSISTNGSGSRLSELRDRGVVQEVGTKVCSITNQTVILWDVTDRLPIKPRKETRIAVLYYCSTCDRGMWAEVMTHSDKSGQYCIGKIKRYREVK